MAQSKFAVCCTKKGREPAGDERDLILKAAYNGDVSVLTEFSMRGVDIASACDWNGETILHKAALGGKTEVVRMLVDAGVNVDAKNIIGLTPLHKAAYNGHKDVIKILVDSGAAVDAKSKGGLTPLTLAASKNHNDVVELLVSEAKADLTMVDQEERQKIKTLVHTKELSTPVIQASKERYLIDKTTVIAYQEAMKKGKCTSNKFKIVMLGSEGAGKTSTVHSLLGKEFQSEQPSTVGAALNSCTINRIYATEWKQTELQYQIDRLPKQLNSEIKSFMSTLRMENVHKNEETFAQEFSQTEKVSDEIEAEVQKVFENEEVTNDEVRIVILDLGGQEIYYEIHFLFLSQEDIVLLTFDASKPLDQPVTSRQRLTRFQEKVKTRGLQTSLQIMETLLQSVYSQCGITVSSKVYISNRIPTIIVIGTHAKDLSLQQKENIMFKFYKYFSGKPFMDHLPRSRSEAFFFVDNSARDPLVFAALKNVTLKAAAATIAKECPISYLQFEVEILKISETEASISKQKAMTIAEKAGLQNSLVEVLHYYTNRGILLYYPEVESLQNEVFIAPQKVSDLISSIVSTEYCEPSSAELQRVCDRYENFGILEESLADDILKNSGLYKDKNTIFGFLEKFNLAVEVFRDIKFIDEEESYITPSDGRVYFVPSMLRYNETKVYTKHKQNLVVQYLFPDKFVSESMFNQMLVKTVVWCRQNGHHIQSIYRGVGAFQFKDGKQGFRLQESQDTYSFKCCIKIYKQKLTDDVLQVMLQHRQQLLMHLQKCVSEVHHSHIPCAREPIIYLECPLQHDESCLPHIRLDRINISEDLVCPKSDHQIIPFETYALLFTASLANATVGTSTPTLKELHRYVRPEVASQWYDLGVELLNCDQMKRLDVIKCDYPGLSETCCTEMFKYWLQVDVDASWDKLLKALKHTGYNTLADKLKNEHLLYL